MGFQGVKNTSSPQFQSLLLAITNLCHFFLLYTYALILSLEATDYISNVATVRVEQQCKHSHVKIWHFCFYLFKNRPICLSKRLFKIHQPTKKLITKLKIVVYCNVIKKWMLWSYIPGLTMFEFINQYHFLLSGQPFPTSHINCIVRHQRLFFGLVLKRDPKLHNQPYSGIYTICTSVTAVFYHSTSKIQFSPVR